MTGKATEFAIRACPVEETTPSRVIAAVLRQGFGAVARDETGADGAAVDAREEPAGLHQRGPARLHLHR